MTSATLQRRPSRRSVCQITREWVQLALATAAGAAFIWQCLRPDSDMRKCSLLLFLCLTFFGRQTVLRHLLSFLKHRPAAVARE
ncbi:MAG: hypothetical protein IPK32_17525 [Verrucomicrobiaceae bacterium]|nr:hypothetical protein [Verrucomicrobiaceae bacterium]